MLVQKLNMQCKNDTLNVVCCTNFINYNKVRSRRISNVQAKDFFPFRYKRKKKNEMKMTMGKKLSDLKFSEL